VLLLGVFLLVLLFTSWRVSQSRILPAVSAPQEKLDFVVPIATLELGMVGISLSVGSCCDGVVDMPGEEVFTVGDGVYWPHERYRDFRPLPQAWMAFMTLSADPVKTQLRKSRKQRRHKHGGAHGTSKGESTVDAAAICVILRSLWWVVWFW
jgi:hypothetical protein